MLSTLSDMHGDCAWHAQCQAQSKIKMHNVQRKELIVAHYEPKVAPDVHHMNY